MQDMWSEFPNWHACDAVAKEGDEAGWQRGAIRGSAQANPEEVPDDFIAPEAFSGDDGEQDYEDV